GIDCFAILMVIGCLQQGNNEIFPMEGCNSWLIRNRPDLSTFCGILFKFRVEFFPLGGAIFTREGVVSCAVE
ncbi:MAG: hypothetical protein KDK71_08050, partial [Chlamydiia bacterium]|nr:hypothetical protein [Chlamydiia bacterium]